MVRMKKDVLSWVGHVKRRMNDERMAKKIYEGKVSGKNKGMLMIVDEAKEVCRSRRAIQTKILLISST